LPVFYGPRCGSLEQLTFVLSDEPKWSQASVGLKTIRWPVVGRDVYPVKPIAAW